jgi:hypothetical protein
MRLSIAIVISSILISAALSGCSLISVAPSAPEAAPCVSAPVVAHPKLAPVKYESCAGTFEACFTHEEFDQLSAEIAELKKEAGR